MNHEITISTAKDLFAKSEKTGGGPKTSMPVDSWLSEISDFGLTSIPTFHGEKKDQDGYRSGEVHGQLRKVLDQYFYAYRVSEGQTYLFIAKRKKVFVDIGEPNPVRWLTPKVKE